MIGMTPPDGPDQGDPAAFSRPQVLTKRRDFVAASHARRQGTPGIHLQGRRRDDGSDVMRVGYTCSKKVGNAVARNRAKRRLREAARAILPTQGRTGWDYVLIGRAEATAARPFEALKSDLEYALRKLHGPDPRG